MRKREKEKNCHPNIHHKSRGAELIRLYKELDQEIENHFKKSDWHPPCKAGCYQCCYDDFDISQTEFDLIINEMTKWPPEQYKAVFEKALNQARTQVKEKPELMEMFSSRFESVMYEQITRGRKNTLKENRNSFPCPLLDENTGKCRVYHIRPFVCRLYGTSDASMSDDSDRELCEKMPSRKAVKDKLFDAGPLTKKYFDIIEPYFKEINERIIDRKYPIYVWFMALFSKKMTSGARYLDDDNLMVDMKVWNKKTAR